MQAFKRTSKVREAVKEGLEDLTQKFEDTDVFCRIYFGQDKIAKAALTLHVSILKAVEDVIGFYTKHIGKRSPIAPVRDFRVWLKYCKADITLCQLSRALVPC